MISFPENKGDIYFQDAGDGYEFYRIVTRGASDDSPPRVLVIGIDPQGEIFNLNRDVFLALTPTWPAFKYGDLVPLEVPNQAEAEQFAGPEIAVAAEAQPAA